MAGVRLLCAACLVLAFCDVIAAASPSIAASPKMWWSKQIIENKLYTAGRLTDTQVKQASEVGIRTLISLVPFPDSGSIGGEILLSTGEEKNLTRDVGMAFDVVLGDGESYKSAEAVKRFSAIYDTSMKPVLLHCEDSYEATFVALMHHVSAEDSIDPVQAFEQAQVLGFNFVKDEALIAVASELNGGKAFDVPAAPVLYPDDDWYKAYWQMQPIYRAYYVAGQFRNSHTGKLKTTDMHVYNLRLSATDSPHEEVTLLNVKDDTGEGRQQTASLEKNRINSTLETTYISPTSAVNYQSRNPEEFGDDIGYSTGLEQQALEDAGITWQRYVFSGDANYTKENYNNIKPALKDYYDEKDPVFLHCRTSHRAASLVLLLKADEEGMSVQQLEDEAAMLGIHYDSTSDKALLALFADVLRGNGGTAVTSYPLFLLLGTLTALYASQG